MNIFKWTIFILFAVLIGLYPLIYVFVDMSQGLMASKSVEVRSSSVWLAAFYVHMFSGGIALLSGWSQFSRRFRNRNPGFHRTLGKVYLIAVVVSGIAGLYIAQYATGGIISILGFSCLATAWVVTSLQAYVVIRRKDPDQHQHWMIRSYALCWAAVMLRLWIPLFQIALGMEFIPAYRIIAWFCWVPNLVVAEMIIRSLKRDRYFKQTAA